ncbi:motility-associated protein Scm1 [Spiroplasma turonicum]|uniref:Motility-associated protein Scm1 n=1 Tax=Spiroplasma turonicum TaxID=216946 RepID=A0A0K1P5N1_9MOLU|nr:motility-associated protein Scm1 [Spiroplasma turonicum]AKU79636.1 hypothetical protein STURON_00390 [Spiroplasma turonicum]ALX70657.1 hypothetical protein STURO_v1c03890 [Spiroplasma turonicum]
MKQKGIITILIVFSILFISTLIVGLSFNPLINVNQELLNSNINEKAGNNISNSFDLAYFIFGYKGFLSILRENSFNFIIFSLFWVFLLPTFFSFFILFLSVYLFTVVINNIRREYKYKTAKAVGKNGMYITFFIFILFVIITISLFSVLDSSFKKVDNLKNIFNDSFYDSFSVISLLKVLANCKLFNINNESVGDLLGQDFNYSLLTTSLVFGVIFLPLIGISLIIFTSIWIATFVSVRNSSHSKFRMWLRNIRIDSKREFYSLILKNIWLWLVTSAFLITIIIPGLVHPYKNSFQITLAIISILCIPLVFIPLIIGMTRIVKIRRFNYNLLMFIQIMVLIITVISFQLTIWVLFKDEIQVHSSVSSLIPFITISLSIFAEFGFIKLQKR